MLAHHFATDGLPKPQRLDAWRAWYETVFDVTQASNDDFVAENSTWAIPGLMLSRVASPANLVTRTKSTIRRNSMDHWVITLSKQSVSNVTAGGRSFDVPPGLPFILSFGEEISINRKDAEDRLQLILARDSFPTIAPLLDAARYRALNTPGGRMLADYMLLLEQHMPAVEAEAANRLNDAVQSMLVACVAPLGKKVAAANDQVRLTVMERVRRAVHRNLRSPSLGPTKLCQEAATSRSQLYRLLKDEGGVARYIQRRRLSESLSMLCDVECGLPITQIAEVLCFSDASAFSRAFRREFGMSPRDVRAGAPAGLAPAAAPNSSEERRHPFRFRDCLRGA